MNKQCQFDVIIIGGGAAGLYLSSLLSGSSLKVALIDGNDRLGKKLALTGNGQGNISNIHVSPSKYVSEEKDNSDAVRSILGKKPLSVLDKFSCVFDTDEKGRIYPNSRQASSIVDLLRLSLKSNITLFTGVKVRSVKSGYSALLSDGRVVTGENLVLATGGKAQPKTGSDGSGYSIAESLGHSVTSLYPGLVQLKTDTDKIKSLKGKRVLALVKAYDGDKIIGQKYGDLIFTDYGVTGDSIFGLSSVLTPLKCGSIVIDFFPNNSEDEIAGVLRERSGLLEDREIFTGMVNNIIGRMLYDTAKDRSYEKLAEYAKNFRLKVTGNMGFDNAQVTIGGVRMSEVTESLESRKCPGLYFAGEILDVTGECGGYNLHWAFACAERVYENLRESYR